MLRLLGVPMLILLLACETHQNSRANRNIQTDIHGRVQMGVPDINCDTGMDNLTVDWDESPLNYTCYSPKNPIPVSPMVSSVANCDEIPAGYAPQHYCMKDHITYDSILPTHEGHRPVWPVYGEYKFVPPQRWLHSVEHGAIVLLYHPCADPFVVKKIKGIVKSCLRRYVITANNLLPTKLPIALIAWGCRYSMNDVNTEQVVDFIKNHALRGPEQLAKDGIYNLTLLEKSKVPPGSDFQDSVLCPGQ